MKSFFQKCFWVVCAISLASLVTACGADSEGGLNPNDEPVGVTTQALDAARSRVVQEASLAMSGSYTSYTTTNWPTGETKALYNYTLQDLGAWNSLINSSNYSGYGYTGFFVSCMRYRSEGHLPSPYTSCALSTSTGFGSFEMPYYTCQGSCPDIQMRGGQCKPFMNLVAYRSGQYHGSGTTFKAFPSDSVIDPAYATPPGTPRPPNDANMPLATYANILEGDFLRRPAGHAAIVVRKISSTQVVIFDSNWIAGGDGYEIVGSHTLGFSGSGNSNLGNYRVLKCAYMGAC